MAKLCTTIITAAILLCHLAAPTNAKNLTAKQAVELASQSVPPLSRTNLIAIHGERSEITLNPTVWYVWFYEPGAMQNGNRVKVAGGVVQEVREGLTELNRARVLPYEPEEIILSSKFVVDSSEALARLRAIPQLRGAQITSTSFDLRKPATRFSPVWNVRLWGRYGVSAEPRFLGTGEVSAETGEVIRFRRAPQWLR
jgi:hypothetical protein